MASTTAGVALAVVTGPYFRTGVSWVLLFWAAFILTRPLGATVGGFPGQALRGRRLALSRPIASAVIASLVVLCIVILPQRRG